MAAFEVEEQESRTYLVYTGEETDTVNSLVLGMLENNKIEGTLPFLRTQVDRQIYYRYDITGLRSVAEYLGETVSRHMLFTVIEGLLAGRKILEEYMLDMGAAVLDSRYVYIRPSTEEVCLLLLPVRHENAALEIFLKQMIVSVRYDPREDCSYIAGLLSYFNGEKPFSPETFADLIGQLKQTPVQGSSAAPVTAEDTAARTMPLQQPALRQETVRPPAAEGTAVSGRTVHTDSASVSRPADAYPAAAGRMTDAGTTVLSRGMYPNAGNAGHKYVNPNLQNMKNARGSQLSLPAAPEGAREKKGLLGKRDKKETPGKEKRGLFGKKEKKGPSASPDAGSTAKRPLSFKGIAIPGSDVVDTPADVRDAARSAAIPEQDVQIPVHTAPIQDFGRTVDLKSYMQQTSVLESGRPAGAAVPCLVRKATREQFFLSKAVTRIGRSRENVDIYITDNTSIGRMHAVLYWENGRVYIEDQQSQNGTFINDRRVTGRQELVPGCRLRMSNEEFEFCMGPS